jgi:predicted solute-binding protein
MAPTPTVDPQAAVDVHVAATVAYLAVLLKEAAGSDAAALGDIAEMRDTLEQEDAWLAVNADPGRVAIAFYREKVAAAIDVLSTALGNQTSAYITAALDAVTMASAEGSLVAAGD